VATLLNSVTNYDCWIVAE